MRRSSCSTRICGVMLAMGMSAIGTSDSLAMSTRRSFTDLPPIEQPTQASPRTKATGPALRQPLGPVACAHVAPSSVLHATVLFCGPGTCHDTNAVPHGAMVIHSRSLLEPGGVSTTGLPHVLPRSWLVTT